MSNPSIAFPSTAEIMGLHKEVVLSGVPNFKGCRKPVYSKIDTEFLEVNAADYDDAEVVEFLRYGWPVGVTSECPVNPKCKNHNGALEFPDQIDRYLEKEIAHGAVLGPFPVNPLYGDIHISPMNSVPKKDSEDRRVILDLSYPRGRSVNDAIPKDSYLGDPFFLHYPSVDSLVEDVKSIGQGCLIYKRDLRRAYRQFPIDPGDYKYLGYTWNGEIYIDRVLPMGLRSACQMCQRVTNLISHIFRKKGHRIVNYLDDLAGASEPPSAEVAFCELGELLSDSGLEESPEKAASPSTRMVFLGIELDTVEQTLQITPGRMAEIRSILAVWENKLNASKREVQSLVGKLQFAGTCVRPGRIFISRMLNFLRTMPDVGRVEVPEDFLKDARWWRIFIGRYNGISMMPLADWSPPDQTFACDACLTGCGGWSGNQYFHSVFPETIALQELHINALELLTIVICIKVWGKLWKSKRILVYCDNDTSVQVLNSGKTRDPFLQACVREICYLAALGEFEIRAVHLPGRQNILADLLSRWEFDRSAATKFSSMFKGTQQMIPSAYFDFSHLW